MRTIKIPGRPDLISGKTVVGQREFAASALNPLGTSPEQNQQYLPAFRSHTQVIGTDRCPPMHPMPAPKGRRREMTSILQSGSPTIFISYSHKDERWLSMLEGHLKALVLEKSVRVWSDQLLRVGDDWHRSVLESIARADIAILLVSSDYLSSDFIRNEEVPQVLERRRSEGMLVAPVICRPCLWRFIPWLSSMIVRPRDGRPLSSRKLSKVEMEITTILEEVLCLTGH